MKVKSSDFEREKKIHKVVKGSDKSAKHRKSIYNFVEEDEEDLEDDFEYETNDTKHPKIV